MQAPVTSVTAPPATGRLRLGAIFGALFVVGLVVALPLFEGGERLRDLVQESGAWSPMVYVAAKAATTVVAPVSGMPLKAVSGALFGVGWGIFYSVLGDVIGGCLCFWISRLLGQGILERFAGSGARYRVEELADRSGGWRAVLFGRLALSSVYNLVSYAAGLTRLPFWKYLLVTVFGGILHTSFLVSLGASTVLDWRLRLAAYVGVGILALLTLVCNKRLQRLLVRDARPLSGTRDRGRKQEGQAAT